MSKCELRWATDADYLAFYGEYPPGVLTALLGEVDGGIVGIGGVSRARDADGGIRTTAFMDLKEGAEKHKRALVRATRMVMARIAKEHCVVYALASDRFPSADLFLEHFGFRFRGLVNGQEMYVWRRQ